MTIVRPRAPHLSLPGTTASLAVLWTISVIVATPTLLYSTTVGYGEDMQRQRQACLMIWPDGDPRSGSSSLPKLSEISFFEINLTEIMNQTYSVSVLDHYYQVIYYIRCL